ncbi:conserved hypothetical protein [Pirellula staleyi DSM 6068]|uniref:Urease accessory protein UreH-like transmembrane domain-containing protein n=1 Tax=Pirellula staleyi (strain ATCC 27377 / DSM 6068 / ICPB 4128) TaxID=530564 RepID=D2QYL0_PIRSD|nr:sulfite exporter TauE/SafE family protein [Pirellula staleyi]ADB18169.1 conserved hypothetical protein [Pirellula staleyi DSM 6068]
MIELPLIFMTGILGASHCLGMCGPLALIVGVSSSGWSSALARQIVYSLGRIFTYAVLGAVAGYAGDRLSGYSQGMTNVPAVLAILAGLMLVYQGAKATGIISYLSRVASYFSFRKTSTTNTPSGTVCLAGGMIGKLLRQPHATGAFMAGMATGLLPCGLLYGMLALAVSTHQVAAGALLMIVFGLGTTPMMIVAGLGGRLLSLSMRRSIFALAAWCLLLTGAVSIVRGASFLAMPGEKPAGCPFCSEK